MTNFDYLFWTYQRFGFLTFCLLLVIYIPHILHAYEYETNSN